MIDKVIILHREVGNMCLSKVTLEGRQIVHTYAQKKHIIMRDEDGLIWQIMNGEIYSEADSRTVIDKDCCACQNRTEYEKRRTIKYDSLKGL